MDIGLVHGIEGIGYMQRMEKECSHCQLVLDAIVLDMNYRTLQC